MDVPISCIRRIRNELLELPMLKMMAYRRVGRYVTCWWTDMLLVGGPNAARKGDVTFRGWTFPVRMCSRSRRREVARLETTSECIEGVAIESPWAERVRRAVED